MQTKLVIADQNGFGETTASIRSRAWRRRRRPENWSGMICFFPAWRDSFQPESEPTSSPPFPSRPHTPKTGSRSKKRPNDLLIYLPKPTHPTLSLSRRKPACTFACAAPAETTAPTPFGSTSRGAAVGARHGRRLASRAGSGARWAASGNPCRLRAAALQDPGSQPTTMVHLCQVVVVGGGWALKPVAVK